MDEANGILLLFDILSRKYSAPIRILDLYYYLRHALTPGVLPSDLADLLRAYDSSMLFLVLEHLRTEGLVDAAANTYSLTEKGATAVSALREERAAVIDNLEQLAGELAA